METWATNQYKACLNRLLKKGWNILETKEVRDAKLLAQRKDYPGIVYEFTCPPVRTSVDILRWLASCETFLNHVALPVAGHDLSPEPFFTALHYSAQ